MVHLVVKMMQLIIIMQLRLQYIALVSLFYFWKPDSA